MAYTYSNILSGISDIPSDIFSHGSLNVPMFHITQPLGIWSINVYNGYYKVMSNIPKSWDIYQPLFLVFYMFVSRHAAPHPELSICFGSIGAHRLAGNKNKA